MVAAVLATLFILAPVASAADPLEYDYAENSEDPVATFSASDEDADAADIEWSLDGADKADFEISDDGELTFKKSPNFEKATDRDEDGDAAGDQGKGDNVYKVTVVATGDAKAEQAVEVTVTDEEEAGSVSFSQPQPQATRDLTATLKDEDVPLDNSKWQWSRGSGMEGPWEDLQGQTNRSRMPTADDVGSYLRATVTYSDKHGDQTASGVTENAVEARTFSNARPEFPSKVDPIEVNENVAGNIGDPIAATDANNDVLLYSIVADPADATSTSDDEKFNIGRTTGQLSLKAEKGHDFENSGAIVGASGDADMNATVDDLPDDTAFDPAQHDDGKIPYTVTIRATDPSGATGDKPITVYLLDVNEAPEFSSGSKDQATLYIDENATSTDEPPLALYTHKTRRVTTAEEFVAVVAFSATDDDTAPTKDGATTYEVEGADEEHFTIGGTDGTSGTLEFSTAFNAAGANFEDKSSYSITIVARTRTDGVDADATAHGARGAKYGRLDVTINVVDQNDPGDVMLSEREPQVGRPVLATLDDDDGGESAIKWYWFRGLAADTGAPATKLGVLFAKVSADGTVAVAGVCDADAETPIIPQVDEPCFIDKATSALYVPKAADADPDEDGDDMDAYVLYALVGYKDNKSSTVTYAMLETEEAVQLSDPGNTAPSFPDQDLNTAGDQSDTTMRQMDENVKGVVSIGEPVVAVDGDADLLVYRLSGPDAASFTVDSGLGSDDTPGQVKLKKGVALDFEAKAMHTVTVMATDPSGASDTITVMIEVIDKDDPPTISGDKVVEGKVVEVDYAENGEEAVATVSASDEDADAADIEWSLDGADKADFEISDDGELTFKKSPNFEKATDRDEDGDAAGDQGKGDNVYKVTVVATGDAKAEQAVEVTVTDEEEAGSVSFSQPQPQATRGLTATLKDEDVPLDNPSWQWSRGPAMEGPWEDLEGQTNRSRVPTADDVGSYLRATVTYSDKHGDQTASGVTENAVEARTLANARPEFPSKVDPIEVNENVAGNIGDPIAATDANNDVLLYSIVADPADATSTSDDEKFNIGRTTGQLSLKAEKGHDFENSGAIVGASGDADMNATVDDLPDDTAFDPAQHDDGKIPYTVTIRATDPSGATGDKPITVYLLDVNEAPEFSSGSKDQATLYIDENATSTDEPPLALYTHKTRRVTTAEEFVAVVAFSATDDDTAPTKDGATTYEVEGADEEHFTIGGTDGTSGTLEFSTAFNAAGANFEDKSSYSITIVARTRTDGVDADATAHGARGAKYGRLDVTINVVDQNDPGDVMLSEREPQVGRPVLATLDDDDGGESAIKWYWFRGLDADTGVTLSTLSTKVSGTDLEVAAGDTCTVEGVTGTRPPGIDEPCFIDKATSALYTPKVADADANEDGDDMDAYVLYALVGYKDNKSSTVTYAMLKTERAVQLSDPGNTAPSFPDQDLNTAGDQSDTTMRQMDENVKGVVSIGEPVVAVDGDDDLLVYRLSGPDAASFTVDSGLESEDTPGQLKLKKGLKLDFEAQAMHTVTVMAMDPSGASDTITVMIEVIDKDDPPAISPNRRPVFDDGETTGRSIAENSEAGTPVGDPVMATDADSNDVTYSLSGDDAMYFEIDDMGQITVGEGTMLDYESDKKMYMVTVTANDGTGVHNATGSIAVTIMVTDVNDYSPMFDAETAELMVAENTEAGMPVGDPLIATDGDGEDVTYSLGGDDAMYFAVGEDTGQITVGEGTMLDYESDKTMYMVTVTADDGTGADNATGSIAVTIMVTDVNDYSPMFESETAELMVAENTKAGMPVGDPLIATDGDGEDVTYSLSGDDAMYFAIGEETGQIAVGEGTMLDYESDKKMYMVTVTADDGTSADNATGSIAVTIMVIDNTPPAFASATANRSVEENQDAGTAVGDPITASDAEGDAVTYSMESMYFEIDGEGQITTAMMLDYETMDSHTVTVTASDDEGSDSIEVTIRVIDNPPPAFPSATANRRVDENLYAGATVGDPVTAMDDEGDTVTYTLSESMYFEIDENSGQITTTMMLDEEDMSSHMVTVTATDTEGDTDSVNVVITVNDSQPGCDTVGDVGLVNDCEALLDSEDELGGSLNWADDTPMSDWDGVTMSDDRVTAIDLRNEGLDGTISGALGRLSMLASLNLRSNSDLSGEIPGSLNYLSNLTVLNLHSNSHTGGIPDLSGTSLVELYLPGNDLTGEVPAWLNTMTDMTELWLWGNDLSGTLPDLSGMTSLNKLKLNGNTALTGIDAAKLPDGLRWLIIGETDIGANAPDLSGTSLTTLWMNETGLSGAIPVGGIPTSVTSLNLKDNSLSGAIPDMSGLNNLRYLRLHRNDLSGDIPGTMGDLESLERLWIYDNDLTGIAAGFANASDTLTHLELRGNSFAEGTCLPGELAMVENNDFEDAGLAACSQ